MNERERAENVARAVDALIRGADTNEAASTGDEDLDSLLNVARARLETSLFAAKASLQHETTVWTRVLKRMEADATTDEAAEASEDDEADEFADIIIRRRKLAQEAALLAEPHREAVWQKIQSRIAARASGAGIPAVLRSFRRKSDAIAWEGAPVDLSATSPQLTAPMPPGQLRLATGQMAESTQELARARVWARVMSNVAAEETTGAMPEHIDYHRFMPRLALAAAAAALFVLAVGPLPATGFADHPAVRLVEAIGDQVGARQAPPPSVAALPTPNFVIGAEASVTDASAQAGVQFTQPSQDPDGFELTSSRFYPQGMTGEGAGIFALTYASDDSFLTVYQEAAGGSDLAAEGGSMNTLQLSDGSKATLIEGTWTADAGGLSWASGADQTLVFERNGVRVIAEFHGEAPSDGFLTEFAGSLR